MGKWRGDNVDSVYVLEQEGVINYHSANIFSHWIIWRDNRGYFDMKCTPFLWEFYYLIVVQYNKIMIVSNCVKTKDLEWKDWAVGGSHAQFKDQNSKEKATLRSQSTHLYPQNNKSHINGRINNQYQHSKSTISSFSHCQPPIKFQ